MKQLHTIGCTGSGSCCWRLQQQFSCLLLGPSKYWLPLGAKYLIGDMPGIKTPVKSSDEITAKEYLNLHFVVKFVQHLMKVARFKCSLNGLSGRCTPNSNQNI